MTELCCERCGAALAVPGLVAALCPYCGTGSVVERPAAGAVAAELVVPFASDAAEARRALDRWLGRRRLFADGALRRARATDLRGVYVPAYVYSAATDTEFTAQIGESYTVMETVEVREGGATRREQRPVTRTEYRPLAGRHVGYVADVLVSASAALSDDELARVAPFDLRRVRRFAPELVAGWTAEDFARPPAACRDASRTEARDQVGAQLRRFMPGDGFSDLVWRTALRWEALQPILVPVWLLAVHYRDDRPALRVAINGQTGQVGGAAPLAPWKIAIAVALVAAVALALWWWFGGRQP